MERIPHVPTYEQDYWESWNDQLGLPSGTVYSARSYRDYQNAQWNKDKLARRHQNISLATGRVNGRFVQHGNKR